MLSSAVGVQVKRYGGLGSFSTVSIRGSTAEQVVVYLDGVPLNQAIGGGADVGRMSLGGVQEIQVYRGAVPARFGVPRVARFVGRDKSIFLSRKYLCNQNCPNTYLVAAITGVADGFGSRPEVS